SLAFGVSSLNTVERLKIRSGSSAALPGVVAKPAIASNNGSQMSFGIASPSRPPRSPTALQYEWLDGDAPGRLKDTLRGNAPSGQCAGGEGSRRPHLRHAKWVCRPAAGASRLARRIRSSPQ